MPERTGSAMRAETPRDSTASLSTRALRSHLSFILAPYYLYEESYKLSHHLHQSVGTVDNCRNGGLSRQNSSR